MIVQSNKIDEDMSVKRIHSKERMQTKVFLEGSQHIEIQKVDSFRPFIHTIDNQFQLKIQSVDVFLIVLWNCVVLVQ
jgi:hypothetical protein